MADKKKYKDTLNLPRTDFDMRAGLLKKEPAMQQQWQQQDLYGRLRDARREGEPFVFHDGPPYANGDIHMGHALNKTLKDMVLRSKYMAGYNVAPMIHGWDCHGQPIEQKIVENLGDNFQKMSVQDIRKLCREYAKGYVQVQSEQFQRLGVLGDFDQPYITMDPAYEQRVLEVFARLVEQGAVFRQLKPVHWSIANRTALAEAELEYKDVTDESIMVALELSEGHGDLAGPDQPCFLLIWTTTPWTLPANRAVAVNPNYTYLAVETTGPNGPATLIVARERLDAVLAAAAASETGWLGEHAIRGEHSGADLIAAGLAYQHPLTAGLTCPLVPAEYVTLEDGTGLVHTAPGHGTEDYFTGLANNLEVYCPVLADGTFDETAPEYLRGVSVWDGNAKVIDTLAEAGTLVARQKITHSYPHDWRSKTPTIFRATEQWFIGVDTPLARTGGTLRDRAMEVTSKPAEDDGIDFIPGWGRNRMRGMLESRPDWCISRQRSWGLPIPVFTNAEGEALCTPASVRAVAAVLGEKGSDAWFQLSPAELLDSYDPAADEALENPAAFAIDTLEKGQDIFDVWFESGSSWFAVAMGRGLTDRIPVDLYLEGSDQHRGWFQLSLLPALGTEGVPPFRTVLTHGFVVTEDGHKMSKSLGNAIEPKDQLTQRGADILRLWVASQNYQDDIHCSEDLIAQAEDAYRKLRNTIRFCMGSLGDFDPACDATEPAAHSVDLWMRMELHQMIDAVRQAYDRYEFHRATRLLYEFCTIQASNVYLSAVKDRLYCEAPTSPRRRATQTVLHEVLTSLVKLLAPILPHTAEEAWQNIPNRPADEPDSIHLALLPEVDDHALRLAEDITPIEHDLLTVDNDELAVGAAWVWERIMDLRGKALLKLEAVRNAGVKNPLDTEAVFAVPENLPALRTLMEQYLPELEDLLGVGFARVESAAACENPTAKIDELIDVEIVDTRGKYPRCERSWKRRPDVGSDAAYPDLSSRDAAAMAAIESA
jgi:isoleucyl-tRNA synthetase